MKHTSPFTVFFIPAAMNTPAVIGGKYVISIASKEDDDDHPRYALYKTTTNRPNEQTFHMYVCSGQSPKAGELYIFTGIDWDTKKHVERVQTAKAAGEYLNTESRRGFFIDNELCSDDTAILATTDTSLGLAGIDIDCIKSYIKNPSDTVNVPYTRWREGMSEAETAAFRPSPILKNGNITIRNPHLDAWQQALDDAGVYATEHTSSESVHYDSEYMDARDQYLRDNYSIEKL